MSNVYEVSFAFSQKQMDDIVKIETSNGGPKPKFGKVVVKGVEKLYTEMLGPGIKSRYPDSRTLITGDIRKISYTEKA